MSKIFMTEFSEENLEFARQICDEDDSYAILFENELCIESKNDYLSVLRNTDKENISIFSIKMDDPDFFVSLQSFVACNYHCSPDFIIGKGGVELIWPINLLKEIFVGAKSIGILEGIVEDNDFDYAILSNLDLIFSMGPLSYCSDFGDKTIRIFEHYNSGTFRYIPEYLNHVVVNQNLVICGIGDFDKVCLEYENVVCVDDIEEMDLFLYLVICDCVINLSIDKEIELLLLKVNKRSLGVGEKNIFEDYDNKFNLKQLKGYVSRVLEIIQEGIQESIYSRVSGIQIG